MGAFFDRRPIVAMVISIITIIVGTLSLLSLPTEQYPTITPPMVNVSASYTGANAINVEQSVATPSGTANQWCGQHAVHEVHQFQ